MRVMDDFTEITLTTVAQRLHENINQIALNDLVNKHIDILRGFNEIVVFHRIATDEHGAPLIIKAESQSRLNRRVINRNRGDFNAVLVINHAIGANVFGDQTGLRWREHNLHHDGRCDSHNLAHRKD